MSDKLPPEELPPQDHLPSDEEEFDEEIQFSRLFWLTVGIVGLVIVALVIGLLTYLLFARMERAAAPAAPVLGRAPEVRVAGPTLLADPEKTLEELRLEEGDRLSSYAWVDQGAGIARIPIDRAMAILGARGLPEVEGPAGAADAQPGDAPTEGSSGAGDGEEPGGPALEESRP